MKSTNRNRLLVLRRVRDFLQPMANEPKLAIAYGELEGLVTRLEREGGRQDLHERRARRGTDDVIALARTLRDDLLRPVLQLARALAPDAVAKELPGGRALFLPRSRNQQALLLVASGFHDMAKPYEDRLTAAGLPAGHLAELQRAAVALKAAIDARAQDYLQRSSAVSMAQADGRRAVQIIRLLDSLVVPMLRNDPGRLKAWQQAIRLPRTSAPVDGATAPVRPIAPLAPTAAPATPPEAIAPIAPTAPIAAPAQEVSKAA
jgi:hypothetical protein